MSFDMYFRKNKENPETCTEVFACIDTKLPIELSVFPFNWNCNSPYSAELLIRHLQTSLGNQLEAIRKQAYEEGFKHAKSKKRKFTKFWKEFNLWTTCGY